MILDIKKAIPSSFPFSPMQQQQQQQHFRDPVKLSLGFSDGVLYYALPSHPSTTLPALLRIAPLPLQQTHYIQFPCGLCEGISYVLCTCLASKHTIAQLHSQRTTAINARTFFGKIKFNYNWSFRWCTSSPLHFLHSSAALLALTCLAPPSIQE